MLLCKITAFSVSLEANLNLVIIHTIAIKWQEKYDAVVVNCHHRLRFYGDRMKMNLPKKIFLGRLSLLPGSHIGRRNFGPKGDFFILVAP